MKALVRAVFLGLLFVGIAARVASASPVGLANATASLSQANPCSGAWPVGAAIDGNATATGLGSGWAIAQFDGTLCNTTNSQTAWFETVGSVGSAAGTTYQFTLTQIFGNFHTLGDFTLSYTTDARVGGFSGGETWNALTLVSALSLNGATLGITGNEVIATGGLPATDVYTITTNSLTAVGITGFRLGVIDGPFGPGRQPSNGNFVLTEFAVEARDNQTAAVPEPATFGLLLAGLGVLGYARRRRA